MVTLIFRRCFHRQSPRPHFSVKTRSPFAPISLKTTPRFRDFGGPYTLNHPDLEDLLQIYSSHEATLGLTKPAIISSSPDMLATAPAPNRHHRKISSGIPTILSPTSRSHLSRILWAMTMPLILGCESKYGLARLLWFPMTPLPTKDFVLPIIFS